MPINSSRRAAFVSLPHHVSPPFAALLAVAFLLAAFLTITAHAQEHTASTPQQRSQSQARDHWMMRGRSAPAGQSAAGLRLRAHQQKIKMRLARKIAANSEKRDPSTPASASGSGFWQPLGPAPQISDQNLYGAVSGRTTAVAIDPSDATGNTVYVAAASGGVWQSTDAANSTAGNVDWTALTDQQASLVNGAVSVKPDGSVVLVGTGEPDSAIDSYYGVGILRSTDHGANWTLIPSAIGNNPPLSFAGLGFAKFAWAASPSNNVVASTATTTQGFDDGAITSGTDRGLYYSGDAGQTWTFEVPQDSGTSVSPVSISASDVVYNAAAAQYFAAIRYHGVYVSSDGQNWARLANQPNPTQLSITNCPPQIPNAGSNCPIYRGQFAVVSGRNETYFWFVSLGPGSSGVAVLDQGIWRSTDGGNTWVQINESGIANCGDPGNNGCGVDQGYYNLTLAAIPNGQATDLYAGADNLFKCELTTGTICSTLDSDFPNQWINLTHVYGCSAIASVHPNQHGIDVIIAGGRALMYFANDGGIYRTLDGFTRLNSGTCGTTNGFDNLNASTVANGTIGPLAQFVSLALSPSDENTILGGTEGNGSAATSTATTSSTWSTVNGGDGGYSAIDPAGPTTWFTANPYVNIYSCPNGINCNDDSFSLTVGSGEVGGDIGAYFTPYILDPQNSQDMLVGTCRVWQGAPTVPASALNAISVDFDTYGSSTCTGEEINLVRGLAAGGQIAGGNSATVYATTDGTGPNASPSSGGEVWVTTNAGVTPMADVTAAINPSNYTISSIAMDPNDGTGATAYVGIMGFNVSHVFKTTNAGASWSDWSGTGGAPLPSAPVNALLVDSASATVYAGTDVGIFASSTAGPGWVEVGTPSEPGASGYLPNVPVTAMQIFNAAGTKKLRVATYGRGIWEYVLTTTPDYSNVITNSPQTIYPSQTATFNGMLTAENGYNSSVALSCANGIVPSTCSLNPTQETPTPSGAAYTLTTAGAIGDYNFAVQGVGSDSNAITHNALVTLHIVDFNLSTPSPNSLTAPQGETSSPATFQVAAAGSFSGAVSLSCSGLPSGTTCQFSPSDVVTPTASNPVLVTLTIAAVANAPIGGPTTVTLAANVTGAPAPKTQTFAVTVIVPPPDFALAISATPSATVVNQNVTWNGSLTALHGYTGTVSLSCTGTPPATCTVNPSSIAPSTSGSAFTLTAGNSTVGAFSFTLQATDGTLTHTQPVSLNVGTDLTWTDTGNNSATVQAGQIATYTFSALPVGGATFSSNVSFSCANLPSLTSCNFNPPSISAGAGTTPVALTIVTTGPISNTQKQKWIPGVRARSPRTPVPARSANKQPTGITHQLLLATSITLSSIFGMLFSGLIPRRFRSDNRAPRWIPALAFALFSLALLMACGSLGGSSSPGSGILVAVIPPSPQVDLGGTVQFTATVVNGNSQTVTWAVDGSPTTGSIDANGVYTAPEIMPCSSPLVTVTATSTLAANPGTATVTLTGSEPAITINPPTVSLFANESGNTWPVGATQQPFSASISNAGGSGTPAVTWAVDGAPGNGTIDSNGLYSAPVTVPNPAQVTITATAPAACSPGTASVTINPASPLGTYSNIQVTATAAGGPAHTDLVTLTVN